MGLRRDQTKPSAVPLYLTFRSFWMRSVNRSRWRTASVISSSTLRLAGHRRDCTRGLVDIRRSILSTPAGTCLLPAPVRKACQSRTRTAEWGRIGPAGSEVRSLVHRIDQDAVPIEPVKLRSSLTLSGADLAPECLVADHCADDLGHHVRIQAPEQDAAAVQGLGYRSCRIRDHGELGAHSLEQRDTEPLVLRQTEKDIRGLVVSGELSFSDWAREDGAVLKTQSLGQAGECQHVGLRPLRADCEEPHITLCQGAKERQHSQEVLMAFVRDDSADEQEVDSPFGLAKPAQPLDIRLCPATLPDGRHNDPNVADAPVSQLTCTELRRCQRDPDSGYQASHIFTTLLHQCG